MNVVSVFSHTHNVPRVAKQEYEMAKEHFREVVKYREATNPDHQQRFRDALDRQNVARERYLQALGAS